MQPAHGAGEAAPVLPPDMSRSTPTSPLTREEKAVIIGLGNLRERYPTTRLSELTDSALAGLMQCHRNTVAAVRAAARDRVPDGVAADADAPADKDLDDVSGALLSIVLDDPRMPPLRVLERYRKEFPALAERHPLCVPTVRGRLEKILPYRLAIRRPPLTPQQRNDRMTYLMQMDRATLERIVWTDEVTVARLGNSWRGIASDELAYE